MLDSVALLFSRIFYNTVFCSKKSICEAFESAKQTIGSRFSKKEMQKFVLMLSEQHKASNCVKSEFYKLEKGMPLLKGSKPKFVSLPPIYQT